MDGDGKIKDYCFSVYVNPNREKGDNKRDLDVSHLEEVITGSKPLGPWRVTKTWCGLIAAFAIEDDAQGLLHTSLTDALGSSCQLAKFTSKNMRNKQVLLLRDVPWAVPLLEIKATLEKQGIFPLSLERSYGQKVKIEVSDPAHYEMLLKNGLDFFGVTRFTAVPERWRRAAMDLPSDTVIQCYRCQNFWHIAAHCTMPPRCVRCGGNHSVESCVRPRNDPFCCHCGGPHHAAYRHCPVRIQISASPIGFPIAIKGQTR